MTAFRATFVAGADCDEPASEHVQTLPPDSDVLRAAQRRDRDLAAARESAHVGHLLEAVAQGDETAFAELYGCTSPRIFGLMLRMLERPDLAQEAMQECYLRVWRRAETYDATRGDARAWLIGVARHGALDLLRARSLRPDGHEVGEEALASLSDSAIGPERAALAGEEALRLDRCLQQLRPEQRRCLVLAYYDGYSHSELAAALGVPLGTAKAWVRRGLSQLRACLRE